MSYIKELDKKYIISTYKRKKVEIIKGKDSICVDTEGKKYIDFTSGIGVNSLGYSNKKWTNAVIKQTKAIQHTSNIFYSKTCVEVAKKLCDYTGYNKVFFSNSGAEANECAIKIARKYSFDKYKDNKSRNKIVTLVNSFHGRTVTTLSATGQDIFHNYFFPFTDGFSYALANDIESVKEKIKDNDVCGIMIELVQGEGGVLPLKEDFVTKLSKLCLEKDILFIVDEVQTGAGRTGEFLTSKQYNIKPNIITMAKGLGGGLPIGCTLTDKLTSGVLSYSDHGTTFGGNPIACAGAETVLDEIMNEDFLNDVKEKGSIIKHELSKCKNVEDISGLGMMIGITLKNKTALEVQEKCIENGLLVLTAKEKVRLLPPLNISKKDLSKGLNILKTIIEE